MRKQYFPEDLLEDFNGKTMFLDETNDHMAAPDKRLLRSHSDFYLEIVR
jgi:hypothetical protein